MNLVVLLLFLAAGELSGWMAVTLAAGAVLAELVRRLGGYESLRAARWSFLPLAFSASGSPLYIWIDPARTAASAAEEMSPAYAAAVEGLDILVNNAGIVPAGALETVTDDDIAGFA